MDLNISADILTSLGYKFFIKGSSLYLKLDYSSDLKENIKIFKRCKLFYNIITVLLVFIFIACLSLMFYSFGLDKVNSKGSDLALYFSFISLLLFVLSTMYIKKARHYVGISRL